MIGGRVLDASTLIDFALVRPYPQALVWTAAEIGMVLAVPATALAEAWAGTPAEAHDALAVLLGLPNTVVEPLDERQARQVGLLLAGRSALASSAADAPRPPAVNQVRVGQVVACGRHRGWPVVSGEATALHGLDPELDVDELP